MKVIAVIPAYNEATRIANAVNDALLFVQAVVVVDDCSKDETGRVALEAGAHLLVHPINRGQGAALQTATDYALQELDADIVVHFDADGQMQGKDIPLMIERMEKDKVDVILGSRFLGQALGMPSFRRTTLKAALLFTRLMSGINISDPHCGFRVLSRAACKSIRFSQDRMAHASEVHDLIKSHHITFSNHPVDIRYTAETLEKGMTFWDGFIVMKDYFKHKFFGL